MLEQVDELGDRVSIQILSLFPGFVLHQIRNSLAARQVVPKGVDRTELHWTLFGFADDDEAMHAPAHAAGQPGRPRGLHLDGGRRRDRLRAARRRRVPRPRLGDRDGRLHVGSGDSRVTETAVRGLWQTWRRYMRV